MKIELVSTEDRSRYLVTNAHEIQGYLNEVMTDKTLVAIYGKNGRDFVLSTLLSVGEPPGYLLLEQSGDAAMNAMLLASPHCTFATTHNQIHLQFSSDRVEADRFGKEAAFRLPMPRELLRLQRRDYYRLGTSVLNPLKCLINTDQGLMETVVMDLSIGGVGVLSYENSGRIRAGELYQGCRLALPGTGEFALSLAVRTTFDVTLKNGRVTHRAGCEFIDLPPSVETAIQRYIISVERERRARYV